MCLFEKIKLVSGRNERGAAIACGAYQRIDPKDDVVVIFSLIPRGKSLYDQQRIILRTHYPMNFIKNCVLVESIKQMFFNLQTRCFWLRVGWGIKQKH